MVAPRQGPLDAVANSRRSIIFHGSTPDAAKRTLEVIESITVNRRRTCV